MRIWVLNHYAMPPDRGVSTRHYDLGRAFTGRGHDVTIFASAFNHFVHRGERLRAGQRFSSEVVDGVRFVWLRTLAYAGNDGRRVLNMLSYLIRVLTVHVRMPRPDVVIASSPHLLAGLAGYLISRAHGATFVFEVRDVWPQALVDSGMLPPRHPVITALRRLERFLYRHADLVVTLLPGAVEYLVGCGVEPGRVQYVPNGVVIRQGANGTALPGGGDGEGTPLVGELRRLRQEGYFLAGYLGAHGPANRVDVLVEAARLLRQRGERRVRLVLVGDGVDKARCQALAAAYALDNITFANPVAKRAVPAVLSALDANAFHVGEAFARYGLSSNKLFDYLASGKPTVFASGATRTPAAESGAVLCIPPESPEALAEALVRMADMSAAARADLGNRGRDYVRRNHDIEDLADRFLAGIEAVRRR